ncbi:uncharacterized protein LOC131426207 [Malaya genurostris]|uniref:uncharacterized protein LOC131426207 n=1 Tax=Malaya genurostris TaxID=325434 RepID=UPI0026F3C831|nr:uncharacterized protein LOC131426207 [Malaya genurostris]
MGLQAMIASLDWNKYHRQSHSTNFISRDQRGNNRRESMRARQMHRGGRQLNRGGFQFRTNIGRGFKSNITSGTNCWRCGGVYHSPNDCNVKDKICNKCGQMGHIQRVCAGQFKRAAEVSEYPPSKIAAIDTREKSEEPKTEDSEIKFHSQSENSAETYMTKERIIDRHDEAVLVITGETSSYPSNVDAIYGMSIQCIATRVKSPC